MHRIFVSTSLFLLLALAGCGGGTTPGNDAGGGGSDTGTGAMDTGTGAMDTGTGGGTDTGTGGGTDTGTGGSTDTGTGGSTDTGTGGSTDTGTDAGALADTGTCPTPPSDLSSIGATCTGAGDCPSGYTCQAMSGIVLQHHCEILCTPGGCPCPATTTCTMQTDKGHTWYQCE